MRYLDLNFGMMDIDIQNKIINVSIRSKEGKIKLEKILNYSLKNKYIYFFKN